MYAAGYNIRTDTILRICVCMYSAGEENDDEKRRMIQDLVNIYTYMHERVRERRVHTLL